MCVRSFGLGVKLRLLLLGIIGIGGAALLPGSLTGRVIGGGAPLAAAPDGTLGLIAFLLLILASALAVGEVVRERRSVAFALRERARRVARLQKDSVRTQQI